MAYWKGAVTGVAALAMDEHWYPTQQAALTRYLQLCAQTHSDMQGNDAQGRLLSEPVCRNAAALSAVGAGAFAQETNHCKCLRLQVPASWLLTRDILTDSQADPSEMQLGSLLTHVVSTEFYLTAFHTDQPRGVAVGISYDIPHNRALRARRGVRLVSVEVLSLQSEYVAL